MMPGTILITGASRGIGLQLVKYILAQKTLPKLVFAACRQPDKADELRNLAKQNSCLKVIALDVTKDSDIQAAFQQVSDILGDNGLNLLINNAGIGERCGGGFLEQQTRERMQSHFDTNVTSCLMVAQKFLPLLKKAAEVDKTLPMSCDKAAIVNVSSIMASIQTVVSCSESNVYHYRASKAALNMVTALMSVELNKFGILVVGLHPGWVKTDLGGPNGELTVEQSAQMCWSVLTGFTEQSAGFLLSYTGDKIDW